jgi:hypothetical protein
MNHAERWARLSQEHEDLIRDASDRVLAAEALLEVRVIEARKVGVTWTTIGRACGIARWSATERFQKLPELQRTLT